MKLFSSAAAVHSTPQGVALSAVRHDRILKGFYLRLRATGKKPLVAMTVCMRKLVILMNRLLKNPQFSQPANTVALRLTFQCEISCRITALTRTLEACAT
jgi:hypothetical protein